MMRHIAATLTAALVLAGINLDTMFFAAAVFSGLMTIDFIIGGE